MIPERSARRRVSAAIGLGLLAAWVAAAAGARSADQQAVRDVFEGYKRALLVGDGRAAADLVDAATTEYWEQLRALARDGDEEVIARRSFLERLLVLAVRQRFPAEVLDRLELAEVMKVAVDAGWIAGSAIEQLEMGEVTVDGSTARGVVVQSGLAALAPADSATPLVYEFVRERGQWRFRFASLLHSLERLLAELLEQLGASEDEILFAIIESLGGERIVPQPAPPPGG